MAAGISRASLLGTWGALVLCFAGCGVQGPPEPPRVERPEAVKDLKAAQVGRTLEISFTPPTRATDGERLTKPLEIEIFRAVAGAGPPSSAGGGEYKPWKALQPQQWASFQRGSKVIIPLELPEDEYRQWQGSTLTVAIWALTRGFRHRAIASDLSKPVQFELLDVSAPLAPVKIQVTEKALELRWMPQQQTLSGRPVTGLAGYRIYRSSTGKPSDFTLRGETTEAEFQDRDFQFDHLYAYKVRAVFKTGSQMAESEDSKVAEVKPKDIFPPGAPTGITAVYTAGAVELVWTANPEPDLAGYNIYRREGAAPFQRLNRELLRTPLFRDTTIRPGHTYAYETSAVDLSGNESVLSEEVQVETR